MFATGILGLFNKFTTIDVTESVKVDRTTNVPNSVPSYVVR